MRAVLKRALDERILGCVLMAATLVSGCGPVLSTCSWLVPESDDGAIEVIAPRRPVEGECHCIGCQAPGAFVLKREPYVIEFWNGERWDPDLFLRARTPEGEPLAIKSTRLVEHRPGTPRPEQYMKFDYFLDFPLFSGKVPPAGPQGILEMEIVDANGRILGTEEVMLHLETRRDWILEGL